MIYRKLYIIIAYKIKHRTLWGKELFNLLSVIHYIGSNKYIPKYIPKNWKNPYLYYILLPISSLFLWSMARLLRVAATAHTSLCTCETVIEKLMIGTDILRKGYRLLLVFTNNH